MNWLDKLERKLGRFALPGLMRVVVVGMALVFCCELLFPQAMLEYYLYFSPALIAQGQVWRIFTFIFLPPQSSLLFIVFALYFYYFIGNALENEWGSFRFTLYYLLGVVGTIIAGLLTGGATNSYLNLSLFFAFAWLFPDMQLMLFFVLPVKVKWLGWIAGGLYVLQVAFLLITFQFTQALATVLGLVNFLVFFGPDIFRRLKNDAETRRRRREGAHPQQGR